MPEDDLAASIARPRKRYVGSQNNSSFIRAVAISIVLWLMALSGSRCAWE